MRVLVIGNPVSGGGRARRLAVRLVERLQGAGHAVELCMTAAPGDARRRAAQVDRATDRLVVVGGDGTLNEVLNGLADPTQIPLTQLATGTANLLARDLRLPRTPEGLAPLVSSGPIRRIDLGLAGERRFLAVASAGFDSMVVREIHERRTGTLGYAAYVRPILRVLRGYRPPQLTVELDGCDPIEGQLVIVSKTRSYGGLFTIGAGARCDLGRFVVSILPRASVLQLLRAVGWALAGGLAGRKGIVQRTAARVAIRAAEPTPVEVDGDCAGTTPVELDLVPTCVPFVVPAA